LKKRDLIKLVEKLGWYFDKGKKHDKMSHPNVKYKLIIPRHNEIDNYTAQGIIEDAEKVNR
jgi:predicted RNA binding protein YcfA (HicA-like mRNA interferase family)